MARTETRNSIFRTKKNYLRFKREAEPLGLASLRSV